MTHFLRFPDEATAVAALEAADLLTEDGDPITASHSHALDVVGVIPETVGWHVNYVGDFPNEWQDFIVTPEQPVRVFA